MICWYPLNLGPWGFKFSPPLQERFKRMAGLPAEAPTHGVKAVPFHAFSTMLTKLVETSSQTSTDLLAKWATCLHVSSQRLREQIPDYVPFVITAFDQAKIKENILTKDWGPFACEWGLLSRSLSLVRTTCEQAGMELGAMHPTVIEGCESALKIAKSFITVVSTLALIINQLPQATKATSISYDHMNRMYL
jgi:hypothetical protein